MKGTHIKKLLLNLLMLLIILLIALPFAYMLASSFKNDAEIVRNSYTLIPRQPTLNNFRELFKRVPFVQQMFNSLFVSVTASILAMGICSLVSYGFSRFEFKGKNYLFGFILATMMIPNQVLIIPQFKMYRAFGWFNTYYPLILPFISTAFGIFLVRQVMAGIPKDLYESATIDGCSELGIYARIAVPLSATGLGILGVLTFMNTWNDFMTPLIYLNKEKIFTLTIGLSKLVNFYSISLAVPMTGALISSIPIILLLTVVGQKYFVQGMISGAVKG